MSRRSFTLVELMIVCGIMAVVVWIIFTFILQANAIFQATDISATLQANSRQAVERLTTDLDQTAPGQIVITPNSPFAGTDMITYHLPLYDAQGVPVCVQESITWDENTVSINLDPSGTGNLLRIERDSDGNILNSRVLVSKVESVQFFDNFRNNALDLNELRCNVFFRTATREGRQHGLLTAFVIQMRN